MKNIYILRHAKAIFAHSYDQDFERELSDTGKQEAALMANKILKNNITFDALISSPAIRTKQTAEIVANNCSMPFSKIIYVENLYQAMASDFMQVINQIDNQFSSILLVGHNPSVSDAAILLSLSEIDHLPTAGMLHISFKNDNWQSITPQSGTLQSFDYPTKQIK
jgi:phosphohistidine phosphatase